MVVEKYKKTISALLLEKEKLGSTIAGLKEEVTLLKSKLENMTKFIRMLNNGSDVLDEILDVGNMSRNMKGIRFDYNFMNKGIQIPTKKFVSPENKTKFMMNDHMSQHPVQHMYPQY